MKTNIKFVEINNTEEHLIFLYKSLEERRFNVSHNKLPSFEDHSKFVLNHPYRVWLLVKISNSIIGNLYIQKDNSIGIHLNDHYLKFISDILKNLYKKWTPLPEIKSIRNKNFILNIAEGDSKLVKAMEEIGAKKIQTTYII
tara:strand:- start:468 stop:893 length:426 start_codon:yes stop_codon:yes gene_type:complete